MKHCTQGFTIIEIMIALILISLIALVVFTDFLGRAKQDHQLCLEFRQQIQQKKEAMASMGRFQRGDSISIDQLKAEGLSFNLNQDGQPICPAGGVISLNSVGTLPTCSKHQM